MDLVEITPEEYGVSIDLVYATDRNFTGRPVYRQAICYLHADAAALLRRAAELAAGLGLTLRVFDALRPAEAQQALWAHTPDPDFLADPRRGSPHSRGVAVDLTLVDPHGQPLEMGTAFDSFSPLSDHRNTEVSPEARRHRMTLLGLMTAAGWDHYLPEWWHYQLFEARRYPLIEDKDLPRGMM